MFKLRMFLTTCIECVYLFLFFSCNANRKFPKMTLIWPSKGWKMKSFLSIKLTIIRLDLSRANMFNLHNNMYMIHPPLYIFHSSCFHQRRRSERTYETPFLFVIFEPSYDPFLTVNLTNRLTKLCTNKTQKQFRW